MTTLLILLALAAVVVFWGVGIYNGLVTARNAYRNAFAQIDVQLQRRFDLIPNLVETAKAYLSHERGTLEAVTNARNAAQGTFQRGLAAAELEGALGRLMVTVEAYPDLKASQNMAQLTEELSSTENKVAFARQAYNDSVMAYNNRREVFPSSLVANNFAFKPAALLEIPAEQQAAVRAAPKVEF